VPTPDRDKLSAALDELNGMMTAAHVAGLVGLGVRLGLYERLAAAGAVTSAELARAAGLDERWVREWLHGQAAARVVGYDGDGHFSITPEVALLLADEDHLFYLGGSFAGIPNRVGLVPQIEEAFRTGIGLSFDERGAAAAADTERLFRNWYRQLLVPVALPMLDGVVDRLTAGATVADVGCGAGVALVEMALAFPSSAFHGYEVSAHALERAATNVAAAGVDNVELHDVADAPLPPDEGFDLITTFDCLHDMTAPAEVVAEIRKAIRPDGTWFIVDINGAATFEDNLQTRMAPIMYAMSVYGCMSSALSEPGGAGLGTLGLPEPRMRELVEGAGFSRFRRIPLDHPFNAFYEARP
jgi:2-polyprenyl-3-methyl-5-hydroxy-6-metoxy-1,4-benzoquinol methylase